MLASLLAVAVLGACASGPAPPRCLLDVVALDDYDGSPGNVYAAYRVRGDAGAEGMAWLAAKTAEGAWISGDALEVGPGEFAAILDLRLTGRPARYKVVLEIQGRRCGDDAPSPASP